MTYLTEFTGMKMVYIDVKDKMVEAVNRAMQSIYKKPTHSSDPPMTINIHISKN